ncbi:MAG: hypothetical protein PHI42_07790 [Paludibacteraceae bacterium]|nr:hypothetical protein [Paludibacteraceae bacterium]
MKKITFLFVALFATMTMMAEVTGTFSGSIPAGWIYITNNTTYPDAGFYTSPAGLKLNYEGQGFLSPNLVSSDEVVVTLTIGALNQNTKTATSTDIFTVTGLNAADEVVATKTLTSVAVGANNTVTLNGTAIVKVKVIMTGYPNDGTKYCNINLTSCTVGGEGGGTVNPTDPTETAMTGFNYVDAIYFTYEEAGYWAFDLYNDYDYDNGVYSYPELYMEVVANNSSTIAGTYEVDYADFSTSETNTIVFASGTITVTALGTIDGDSYPEYSFEGTFQDESGNSYTVSLNKGVWAFNYDTDEDITLNDEVVAIHNVEILDNIYANNGRIYTQDAARIYTITGLDVTSMNGNLEGVYIVKVANKVGKVMVTK